MVRGAPPLDPARSDQVALNAHEEGSFFVKNFTNETYLQAVTNVAGLLNFRVPNIRRHWGLEFRVNLGEI